MQVALLGVKAKVKEIPLTQGKVALVDDEDYERVMAFAWQAKHGHGAVWYARRQVAGIPQSMHHFILTTTASIDHKDGDGLNNTRSNLRPCTNQQNQMIHTTLDAIYFWFCVGVGGVGGNEMKDENAITHIEFPMFSKQVLCGAKWSEIKHYTWPLSSPDGWRLVKRYLTV